MPCTIHPNYTGLRLGKIAKACPECVKVYEQVKASGVKETRGRSTSDPAPNPAPAPVSPSEQALGLVTEFSAEPAPVKRGRGRPRKNPIAQAQKEVAPSTIKAEIAPQERILEAWETKANEVKEGKRARASADQEARESAQNIALKWFNGDNIRVRTKDGLEGILQSEGPEESGRIVSCIRVDGICRWFDTKDVVRI